MRAVVQRVERASVSVNSGLIAEISRGLVALVGVAEGDTDAEARWMAKKLVGLRVFEDSAGKMNRNVLDVGGELLLVPNFTVCADSSKGRRPSFDQAAKFEEGRRIFELLVEGCRTEGAPVSCGEYGAEMAVSLVNNGPVTLVIDSPS